MSPLDTAHPETSKRQSITVTERDLKDLRRIASSPTAMADLPQGAGRSRTALIHAVFERGLKELREADLNAEYAEVAKELQEGSREARRHRAASRPRGTAAAE